MKIRRVIWSRDALFALLFAGLCAVIFWRFLFTPGDIISHGDVGAFYGSDHRLRELTRYLFNDYGSISNLENFNTLLFVKPLLLLLDLFGMESSVNLYRFGTLAFLFISYASMTAFLKWLLMERSGTASPTMRHAIFVASTSFALSPYILNVYPAGGFWLAYALTPVFLLTVYRFAAGPFKWTAVIGLALIFSLLVVGTQYLFFSAFIAGVIVLVEATAGWRHGDSSTRWRTLPLKLVALLAVFLFLNLHWLLPSAFIYLSGNSVNPGYDVTPAMVRELSGRATLFTTVVSADSYVQVNEHRFSLLKTYGPGAMLLRYALAVIGLGGFLFAGKTIHRRAALTLLGLFLLFWTFSIGPRNPLYEWVAFESPLRVVGWIFRASSKLTYFGWVIYAAGMAVFADAVMRHVRRWIRPLLVSALLVLTLLPSINKLYSVFNYYFVPTDLPAAYRDLYSFLDAAVEDDRTKVLYLAPYGYGYGRNQLKFEDSFTWDPGRLAGQVIEQSSPIPAVGYWHLTFRNWQSTLYARIYPEFDTKDANASLPLDLGKRYLAEANVRFVVFHNDIVGAGREGRETVEKLMSSDLVFVDRFGQDVYLFENPAVEPMLTLDNPRGTITFDKLDPTRYRFQGRVPAGTTLRFAQSFDPLWSLRVNGRQIKAKAAAPTDLTAFELPAGDVEGQVEYIPQRSFEIGSRISLPLFLLAVAGLLVARVRCPGNPSRLEDLSQAVSRRTKARC